MLKIYHWDGVETVGGYGHGDIIITAKSLQDARTRARRDVLDWHLAEHGYSDNDGPLCFDPWNEEEDKEEREAFLKRLDKDLAQQPVVKGIYTTICIRGSD